MQLHPRSSALFSAATDSSSRCVPQLPPMAHAPKPISETFHPKRPNVRYFIARILNPFRRLAKPEPTLLRPPFFNNFSIPISLHLTHPYCWAIFLKEGLS